jgi:hypothetical protein
MSLPIALISAVAAQLLCQFYKVISYSLRDRKLTLNYFVTSGGMPSAHSAFVTSLTTSIALSSGVTSDLFAASAVFGFIVMHDAYRLRGTVEKLTVIIRRLLEERAAGTAKGSTSATGGAAEGGDPIDSIELPKMLGHSVPEIVVGIAVGLIVGWGCTLLLRSVAG